MPHFTHLDAVADREGFLVAYPESFNKSWNDTRGLSPADDVGFIRVLIAELQRSHHVDPKRIYATGISNGGFFSNRLACDLTDKLAAIAAVAATMPETLVPVRKPSVLISVMYIHGSKDPLVHIDGGPVLRDRGAAISLVQAQGFWRKWDGASLTPALENRADQAMTAAASAAKPRAKASKAQRSRSTPSKAEAIPGRAAPSTSRFSWWERPVAISTLPKRSAAFSRNTAGKDLVSGDRPA